MLQAIEDSARGLIKGTAEIGGDVGSVARNAVEEAIDSAKSIGLRAEDAASAAANGAMSAAGVVRRDDHKHRHGSGLRHSLRRTRRGESAVPEVRRNGRLILTWSPKRWPPCPGLFPGLFTEYSRAYTWQAAMVRPIGAADIAIPWAGPLPSRQRREGQRPAPGNPGVRAGNADNTGTQRRRRHPHGGWRRLLRHPFPVPHDRGAHRRVKLRPGVRRTYKSSCWPSFQTYLPGSTGALEANIQAVGKIRGVLGFLSIVGLFWTASTVFGAISRAVNRAWDLHRDPPFYLAKLRHIGMAFSVGLLFLMSLATTAAVQVLGAVDLPEVGQLGFLESDSHQHPDPAVAVFVHPLHLPVDLQVCPQHPYPLAVHLARGSTRRDRV